MSNPTDATAKAIAARQKADARLARTAAIRGPLHALLTAKLPKFCGKDGDLRVHLLREAVAMSPEGVYKWLRSNTLTIAAVKKLVALSSDPANVLLLPGDVPPATTDDFNPFLFA